MRVPRIIVSTLFSLIGIATCLAGPPKVIIDTDFNTISDDGQVAVMAAQLYAQGAIDLLGFTIASGNAWRDQEVSDCLKAVERLGQLYTQAYAPFFGSGPPPFPLFIWDTNALAYFVHPEFATVTQGLWVDMHTTFDRDYGKSIPSTSDPFPAIGLLQKSTVIFAIDTSAFYALYVDLLTRPVPVKFVHPPPSHGDLDD
jgi:inosine-uridine nucleoside N-ribohydrolase